MSDLDRCGVLLAAHGERGGGGDNASVVRLAAALSDRPLATEVSFGFIKGVPTIPEALRALTARRIIVYPLFFSDGYFCSVRLPQLLAQTGMSATNRVTVLPPLGADPGLAALVAAKAMQATQDDGHAAAETTIVLLAHGSAKDPASRRASEHLAEQLRALNRFLAVRSAFLEEAPALENVIQLLPGSTVVVGLFAGEGLHGAEDVPRLIGATGRTNVAFAGNVGTWGEIENVVAAAISKASTGRFHRRDRQA